MKNLIFTLLFLGLFNFSYGQTCTPWSDPNGVWKGKGRIAISSDGNEHDHDDWPATPFSLALLAAKGLQNSLVLYTYSDHIWGSNHDHSDATKQMNISALEGKTNFGFTNTIFIEAVAGANVAYNAMRDEILKSTSDNPLFIIGAGPMQVIGTAINNASKHSTYTNQLNYVTIISHSLWNDKHADNPDSWETHTGWTWDEIKSSFSTGVKKANFIHIVDQNGGTGYDGMQALISKFDWVKNSVSKNNSLYKAGSWDWLYTRLETCKKDGGKNFDPSDAGLIIYLLTGKELTDPSDAKAIMENPVAPCGGSSSLTTRMEAEAYSAMSGVTKQTTTDTGGGSNIASINNNDYADYAFNVAKAGTYTTKFRVSSASNGGTISVLKGTTVLGSVNVAVTGGWQTWSTVTGPSINLSSTGTQTIRLKFVNANTTGYLMNLNWWECAGSAAVKVSRMETEEIEAPSLNISLSPNPARDFVNLTLDTEGATILLYSTDYKLLKKIISTSKVNQINVSDLTTGIYLVKVVSADKTKTMKLIKE